MRNLDPGSVEIRVQYAIVHQTAPSYTAIPLKQAA